MLQPKKQKHRRQFRGRSDTEGVATRGTRVTFGTYGLKAMEGGEISSRQIEAARRSMTRYIKRGGKVWINLFPHKPLTKKAAEVPMGSGKGAPDHFVSVVKAGTVIFEMEGIPVETAREAMKLASYKLSIKCRFINTKDL